MSESMPAEVSPDACPDPAPIPPTIDGDIPCMHCSYNLRGLAPGARCPECGTSIDESRRHYKLEGISARWYKALRNGIIAIIVFIVLAILWAVLEGQLLRHHWMPPEPLSFALVAVPWLLRWWGTQLLAEESGAPQDAGVIAKRRRMARLAATTWLIFTLGAVALIYAGFTFFEPNRGSAFGTLKNAADVALVGWLWWSTFGLAGSIARLVSRASLAKQAVILQWIIIGATLLSIAVSSAFRYYAAKGEFVEANILNSILLYLGAPLALLELAAFIWGAIVMVRLYRRLGECEKFSVADAPAARSPWIPAHAVAIPQFVKRLRAAASYHGSPND